MSWFVYIIRCRDNSLYTGISTDVGRRLAEHAAQGRASARYLRGRAPLELVFKIEAGTRNEALALEHRIKKMTKAAKEQLVVGGITIPMV